MVGIGETLLGDMVSSSLDSDGGFFEDSIRVRDPNDIAQRRVKESLSPKFVNTSRVLISHVPIISNDDMFEDSVSDKISASRTKDIFDTEARAMRSPKVDLTESSPKPTKSRKGRKCCYSSKKYGVRTRSVVAKESKVLLEGIKATPFVVPLKEKDFIVGNTNMHADSGTVVVDTEVNKLIWNLDEKIAKVIETGVALGFDLGGKEKVIREELSKNEK
ncbi:hypothetical protein QYF36_021975 [Acer negundo]|nr:hypothetical protein QYF36_021975 [Acer negundo]